MKEWILGRNPVYEVLRARRRQSFRVLIAEGVDEKGRLSEILALAAQQKLTVNRVARRQIDSLTDDAQSHQGVALETSAYPYAEIPDMLDLAKTRGEPLFILALDMVQNPQNLGTLIRSAEAAGVHGILTPLRRAAGVTPAVVHASAGASEHMLVAGTNLAQSLALLKEESNAWVIGLEGGAGSQPYDSVRLDGALVIVVGNEGEGMRDLVRRSCDVLIRLPMMGHVESLNAAVAGSIVLYRALSDRQKRAI